MKESTFTLVYGILGIHEPSFPTKGQLDNRRESKWWDDTFQSFVKIMIIRIIKESFIRLHV